MIPLRARYYSPRTYYSPSALMWGCVALSAPWMAHLLDIFTGKKHWLSEKDAEVELANIINMCHVLFPNTTTPTTTLLSLFERGKKEVFLNLTDTGKRTERTFYPFFEHYWGFLFFMFPYMLFIYALWRRFRLQGRFQTETNYMRDALTQQIKPEFSHLFKDYSAEATENIAEIDQWLYWITPVLLASIKMSFDLEDDYSWKLISISIIIPALWYMFIAIKEKNWTWMDAREVYQLQADQMELQPLASDSDGEQEVVVTVDNSNNVNQRLQNVRNSGNNSNFPII